MSPSLQLQAVTLRVPDLAGSLDFYTRQLRFELFSRSENLARLAVEPGGPELLQLLSTPDAPTAPPTTAGLFHAALLLPNRAALSGWLRHAAAEGVKLEGFSDHGVSEAIYFSDPDGNGLEFYADRPRERWPFTNGELEMMTDPLDLQGLLAETKTPAKHPLTGAKWGHLHLRVTDLERSVAFYQARLGLAVTQSSYPSVGFLAADGYHHHLGLNTWVHPRQPRPTHALGLVEATFAHRGVKSEQVLLDPDHISIRIQPMR